MPTLFLWGALDPAPAADASFALPTLDPPSLYAATLLRLVPAPTQQTLTLAPPSALLHRVLPRLEFGNDSSSSSRSPHARSYAARTDALAGIAPIEQYARTPAAAEQRRSVDDAFVGPPHAAAAARAVALHAVITHQLEPLALHALFSHPEHFRTLAAPTYSYTPHRRPPASALGKAGRALAAPVQIRPRLRLGVQAQLVRHGIWGLAGSAEEEREREERSKRSRKLGQPSSIEDGAGPARVRLDGKGAQREALKRSSRKEMEIGWERAKLIALARSPLDVLNAALEAEGPWLLNASSPTSLDAHLFSALGPILFPGPLASDAEKLAKTAPLASLLRSDYPALVAHATRLAETLWAVRVREGPSSPSTEPQWEWAPSGTVDVRVAHAGSSSRADGSAAITLSAAASLLTSSALAAPAYAWSSVRSLFGLRHRGAQPRPAPQEAEASSLVPQEGLGWGRVVWITSAVVGFVSFIFISGLIQIEIIDEGAVPEGELEGEQEADEDEDEDERAVDEEEVLLEEGEDEAHEGEAGDEDADELGDGDMFIQDDFDDDE